MGDVQYPMGLRNPESCVRWMRLNLPLAFYDHLLKLQQNSERKVKTQDRAGSMAVKHPSSEPSRPISKHWRDVLSDEQGTHHGERDHACGGKRQLRVAMRPPHPRVVRLLDLS